MSQFEVEHSSIERELKREQSQAVYLREQVESLNQEIQRLRQENIQKTHTIEEYNTKILLLGDRDREIESWRDRYNQLQNNYYQEVEQLKKTQNDQFQMQLVRFCSLFIKLEGIRITKCSVSIQY